MDFSFRYTSHPPPSSIPAGPFHQPHILCALRNHWVTFHQLSGRGAVLLLSARRAQTWGIGRRERVTGSGSKRRRLAGQNLECLDSPDPCGGVQRDTIHRQVLLHDERSVLDPPLSPGFIPVVPVVESPHPHVVLALFPIEVDGGPDVSDLVGDDEVLRLANVDPRPDGPLLEQSEMPTTVGFRGGEADLEGRDLESRS